jgi:hypothetical protein
MPRLASDIDNTQTKRIFDVLKEETTIFEGYSSSDVEQMSSLFKILTFQK